MADIDLGYIELAAICVLAVCTVILAVLLSGVRRSLEDTRRESMEFSRSSYEAVNRALADSAARQDAQLAAVRETVDRQLDRMRETVDEKLQTTLDDKLTRSFSAVRTSLDLVYKGLGEMQGLAEGVGDLKRVLSNVKTRGILGEVQLGAILEQILAPGQYDTNAQMYPGAPERVEYAVRMPGSGDETVYLPIDAKFPADAYDYLMKAYEVADPDLIIEARRRLQQALRKSAKDIHDKYIRPPYTTDFAVMFLPFEGLYAEAVNMGATELVQREFKVMTAGPSTMAALLNSLQTGFRTLAIQKHSGEVWKVLGDVKAEFDKFADVLALTQQRIDLANRELDKLIGVRTRSIQRTLGRMQTLKDPESGGLGAGPEDPEEEG